MLNHALVIGKGDYGTAFRLSDGMVCKLYKSYDLAYKSFLKMVSINDNPHLPNIYCCDEYNKFCWVLLDFLDDCHMKSYFDVSFDTIIQNMINVIQGNVVEGIIPPSLYDLSVEMRESAKGFCLDFRPVNFADRNGNLVVFDPFTLRTKHNTHLVYIEKPIKKRKIA